MLFDWIFSSTRFSGLLLNRKKVLLYPKLSFGTSASLLSTSIDFSFSKCLTRCRMKGETAGFLLIYLHLWPFFGSEKWPSIAGGVSVSLQLLALKRDGPGKTMRWYLFDAAECKQWGNASYEKTFVLSGLWKVHKRQRTGINIVIVARSGLPAEVSFIMFAFISWQFSTWSCT